MTTTRTTCNCPVIMPRPTRSRAWMGAASLLLAVVWQAAAGDDSGRTGSVGQAVSPLKSAAPASRFTSKLPEEPAGSKEIVLRQREGVRITDQLGEFQKSGDRYNFYPQNGKGIIRVLENLALERVTQQLGDVTATRIWCVSGILTEYRGENYLLVTRAVLKQRNAATAPAAASDPQTTRTAPPRPTPAS
ncbi:MAG: hypothetical protein AB7O38_11950 [Pirellulaceae bacterium]